MEYMKCTSKNADFLKVFRGALNIYSALLKFFKRYSPIYCFGPLFFLLKNGRLMG